MNEVVIAQSGNYELVVREKKVESKAFFLCEIL